MVNNVNVKKNIIQCKKYICNKNLEKTIFLFRHGQTDYNKNRLLQFREDIPLNEKGIEQAEQNAELLKDTGIECIYSSPLKRAYITGQKLADKLNVKNEIVDNLIEIDGGKCNGVSRETAKNLFGSENYELFFHTKNDGLNLSLPGSTESKNEIRDRILKTIKDICENTKYSVIGISSHNCILRELLRCLNFEDDSSLDNCEVVKAKYKNGKIIILKRIKNDVK